MAKKAGKKDNPPSRSPATSPKRKGRKRSRKASDDGGDDQKISKKAQKTKGDEALTSAPPPIATSPPSSPPKQAAATTTAVLSTRKTESIGVAKRKATSSKANGSNGRRQSISSAAAAFRTKASKAAQDAVSAISNNTSIGIPTSSLPRKDAVKKHTNSGETKNTPAKSTTVSPDNRKRELLLKVMTFWAIASLLTFTALISLIYIGASREHAVIESASSTHELYTRDTRVCGRERSTRSAGSSRHAHFMTFASEKRARSYGDYDADDEEGGGSSGGRGVEIAHCGHCGECSNIDDMTILAKTTQTLTDIARGCSVRGFVASFFLIKGIEVYRNVSEQCMHEKVGFTQPCLECWLDDMVCGIQQCMFTCIKSQYIDWDPKNHDDGRINRCYECDEKLCGPEFLICSGTNRRRQGIRSDLVRNDDMELCTSVDIDWNGVAAEATGGDGGGGDESRGVEAQTMMKKSEL